MPLPAKVKSKGDQPPQRGRRRRKRKPVDPSRLGLCPTCRTQVRLEPQGTLQRHTQQNAGIHACLGAGKKPVNGPTSPSSKTTASTSAEAQRQRHFVDSTGHAKGELAPSDLAWIAGERWLVSLADATPADVVTARRILLAASNGHVDSVTAKAVSDWYQAMKRRPDLFDPRKKAPRWKGAEGDPEKRLGKPSSPGKKVYYREVLVGKRS